MPAQLKENSITQLFCNKMREQEGQGTASAIAAAGTTMLSGKWPLLIELSNFLLVRYVRYVQSRPARSHRAICSADC